MTHTLRERWGTIARTTTHQLGRLTINPVWASVLRELDRWHAVGRQALFWWRDDDATECTPALEVILELANALTLPLALSVIPAKTGSSLATRLRAEPRVCVLQHGWDHTNHAPPGLPESELSAERDPSEVRWQLQQGCERLSQLFGPQSAPVLVPPHNRIAPQLTPITASHYRYLSLHGDFTPSTMPTRNVHIDLIDWKRQQCASSSRIIRSLVVALTLRRHALVSATLPIGILTHHLLLNARMRSTLDMVLRNLRAHPAARFCTIQEVFS